MTERIIPVADLRYLHAVPHIPEILTPANGLLSDTLSRPLRDLRISVTDRCNFRCVYCMPLEGLDWLVPQLSGQPAAKKPEARLPLLPKPAAPMKPGK